MEKISVIMGVYNCQNFYRLKKSIESILNQTYKNFEFIICDDGSTNETYSYLREFSKLDNRIKVLRYSENKGLSYALNYCIKHSSGEFIARQDDDDISHPKRFAKQIDFLKENQSYDFVGSLANVVSNDEKIWGRYQVPEIPQKKDFLWNSPFIHPTIMFRKESLTQVSGYRVLKITRRCEDLDLFMRMYALGIKGYNLQEFLYDYSFENNDKKVYRKFKYRLDEAFVRFYGYKQMNMLIIGIPNIIKPIMVGLIPQRIMYRIKNKIMNREVSKQ